MIVFDRNGRTFDPYKNFIGGLEDTPIDIDVQRVTIMNKDKLEISNFIKNRLSDGDYIFILFFIFFYNSQ